jgi:predicted Zn finger-like uncharacterized protein
MKITCQACQAKYTIADEKVLGKIVKIRCKKCGSTIVVNGADPSADAGSPGHLADGAGAAFDPSHDDWTVNVAEGDQRNMKEDEIVAAFVAGVVDDETYCWKDGMADWAPVREIPGLQAACRGAARAASRPVLDVLDVAMSLDAGAARAAEHGRWADHGTSTATEGPAPTPLAARRAGGRAPVADLFGAVARAGGEDEVMTSAPARLPQPHEHDDAQKLTGARNENSVLFSLSTLTGKSDRPPGVARVDSEASGLIDIRQLSARFSSADQPKRSSGLDDIMNLSAGFTPALTAPILSAPALEASGNASTGSLAPGGIKGRVGLISIALGVGALLVVVAVGGAMQLMHKSAQAADPEKASASASAPQAAAPPAALPTPPATAPTSVASAEPTGAGEATAASKKEEPPPRAIEAKGTKEARAPSAREAAPPTVKVASAATAESDQPFNMGEAKGRLGAVAESAQSCKRGDVSGTGHVLVTFLPAGSVQSAVIDGPPFEGTPTGACVASRFRGVRVPAFGGSPFKVRKSFTIN